MAPYCDVGCSGHEFSKMLCRNTDAASNNEDDSLLVQLVTEMAYATVANNGNDVEEDTLPTMLLRSL